MKPRTGEEDFARLPAFELEGLFGAVLRPPPCTLLITHKGKQMGFLLTLDIDEELANVIIEICSAWEEEEEGQNSFKSVVSRHAHVQNMAQNAQYVAMVAEYARRFAVRRDEIFEGDDFRQLHGFVRVVYGADGQWRAPSGRLDSDLLFQMFSASPRCAWSKPGTLFWGSKLPCHVQGGNMKCCGNKIFPEPPSLPPHSHPRVAADAQRAATMIIQEKMARDKDKGRRRAKGKFAAAAVDDCPIDPENPEHVQILQEELAKMMSDPVQYKASVKLMKRRGVCPRACAAAGCAAGTRCAAKGFRIWCHKCDVACYCSPECKKENRHEHAEVCQIAQTMRQKIGFERVCHRCGVPDSQTRLQVCSQCRQALYCSHECAKSAWKAGHKLECKML